jgi:RHH-type proline utilization regulon transcriptional repressor/proline dehydrogenase/delta 1-pyrroline-5-carboxylate dehydrogenase
METEAVQNKIKARGMDIFRRMEASPPAVFDRKWWAGRVLEAVMDNPRLKMQLFRFIDVFPTLSSPEQIAGHLREYFAAEEELPELLRLLVAAATGPAAGVTALLLRKNIGNVARNFIAGETPEKALKPLGKIWHEGRSCTVDLLGEAALSEAEAARYLDRYLSLTAFLAREMAGWRSRVPEREHRFPRLNLSVKVSSLYSRIGPVNYEDSVARVKERLRPILRAVREAGGFVNLDMEMYSLKNITLDVFTELLDEPEFSRWDYAGIALQAYLKETRDDLERLIAWARTRGRRITVRLVKGAYWEYENVVAGQKGWPLPVFGTKAHTDWHFERCAELMLASSDCLTAAFGTHNVRSLAFVMVAAEERGVPREALEFQMLYGMAEPIKEVLGQIGYAVRDYAPIGELLPGMAYLVRRLLENTSNEGFLRKTFVDRVARESLLAEPQAWPGEPSLPPAAGGGPFRNEPPLDFSVREVRNAYRAALAQVRGAFGRRYPVVIGGIEHTGGEEFVSRNPASPAEVVGTVVGCSRELAENAVAVARGAQRAWATKSADERAGCLFRAAAIARRRRLELSAWEVFETGKSWTEADADVAEAIDYLEYYGREALRLGRPQKMGDAPGEENRYFYQPRGVGVVIAPWNFPLAISTGMVAAALVAGNAVLYKPSSLSAVNGWQLFALLREAGVPDGVLNFVPGRGEVAGTFLVEHREVAFIAFTGSREVGLGVIERAGRTRPGQRMVKRVIAEMGGKNAIIVDADADLDLAVPGVVQSAFGYQGQKCSACSRAIVLADCFDRFLARLAEAVKSIAVGPPEDPANFMGAAIDSRARERILGEIEAGRKEGRVAVEGEVPADGTYVPPTVLVDLPARSRLLREEIFGPVLTVVRARDMEEALAIANDSDYALTGGLFSRSPATIDRVRAEFRVGNLYINRGITGALVGRQPFGGFRLSGVGSKAGGPDYLLQFMEPRVVTENTMRRGFTPELVL